MLSFTQSVARRCRSLLRSSLSSSSSSTTSAPASTNTSLLPAGGVQLLTVRSFAVTPARPERVVTAETRKRDAETRKRDAERRLAAKDAINPAAQFTGTSAQHVEVRPSQSKRPRQQSSSSPRKGRAKYIMIGASKQLNEQLMRCLRSQDASRAMALLREHDAPGSLCKPNVFHYSKAISVLTACRRCDLITEILAMMKAAGVTPDSHVFSGILKCYIECDLPDKAIDI